MNHPLAAWQTFYEIIGSTGGALIGIQFVVIVLIASVRMRADLESINAFGTPNVVHFGSALTIAAVATAPWPSVSGVAVSLAVCGLFGAGYSATIFRRTRRQKSYQPVLEDWVWYVILPCALYASLTAAAVMLEFDVAVAPFLVAAVALSLLLVAIHNAWDSVTHIAVTGNHPPDAPQANERPAQ